MTESNEPQSGWVPLEGTGVWVPGAGPSPSQGPPGWPVPAAPGGPAAVLPRPAPGAGDFGSFGPPPPPPPPGWWGSVPSAGDPPPLPKRRRRAVQAAVAAGALGLAAVAGVGLGHAIWPERLA